MDRNEWPHDKMEGVDIDIEISLKEYGLAWIIGETDTLFYYGIQVDEYGKHTRFDFCTIANDIDIESEYEWADLSGVSECSNNTTVEKWLNASMISKIQDLILYYGYEEIFGSSYWEGLTYEEICNR